MLIHPRPLTHPPGDFSHQTLTGLGVGVTVIAALYFGKDILLPITVAVLLSFVLSPLVGILRRLRIPRVVAVVFSVGLALAIIGGVGALLGSQIVLLRRRSTGVCSASRPCTFLGILETRSTLV